VHVSSGVETRSNVVAMWTGHEGTAADGGQGLAVCGGDGDDFQFSIPVQGPNLLNILRFIVRLS